MYKFILFLLLFKYLAFSSTISFEEALNFTLSNNSKIKNQELNIKASKLDIEKVDSISYGKINLIHEASKTNHAGYVFNSKLSSREASFRDFGFSQMAEGIDTQANDLNYPENRNNFNTKITYEIPLFTGFKLQTQKDIMKIQKKAQELKLKLDKKSLEIEVLKAYNSAVVAKEFIYAIEKANYSAEYFVASANEFYKEGLVTKIDKKQALVHKLNIQSRLTQAKNRFDIALAYLRFLTDNQNITDVKELKKIKNNSSTLDVLYENALQNRDDLNILKQQKKGMKKNVKLKQSDYYPNVYSYLEYGYNDDKITLDSNKDYYLGLIGIKYTLFDASRDIEKQKSQIELNKTLLDINQLKNAIKLDIEKAFLNYKATQKSFYEKQEAKSLSKEVLEQTKQMYKNQLIPMTELLKQEAIFRQNEAQFIMAKYELALASANINLSIGKRLIETKVTK